jgi:hypothetical protein
MELSKQILKQINSTNISDIDESFIMKKKCSITNYEISVTLHKMFKNKIVLNIPDELNDYINEFLYKKDSLYIIINHKNNNPLWSYSIKNNCMKYNNLDNIITLPISIEEKFYKMYQQFIKDFI